MIQPTPLLFLFLALLVIRSGAQWFLNRLNISYLRTTGDKIPEVFKDVVDRGKLETISSYTITSSNFWTSATLLKQGGLLALLLSGVLPVLVKVIEGQGLGVIGSGLVFFAVLSILTHLFRLPFSLYDTFVIEDRYGFNTMTFKTWLLDLAKGLMLSAILGGVLLWMLLMLVVHGGKTWWVWAWTLFGAFELLLMWLFPVVIAPLFNKFEPLENEALKRRIEMLMGQVGLHVQGVFRMDASKRSKHTNAYFTGLGKSKRIVLFDTLLESHTDDEILAVLAHEIGHWKKRHVLKQLILVEGLSLVGFYVVARLLNWPLLFETFGFSSPFPYVGLFLVGILISPLGIFVQPAESALSRRFECEADDFSLGLLKDAGPLRSALKRLAADNLANLTPHPFYAWFYYSHPPLAERIARLNTKGATSAG